MVEPTVTEAIAALPCWSGSIKVLPLAGGLTNHNYLVTDERSRFVVRHGRDIPAHGIMRFNEAAAAKAAHAAGIGPQVIHSASGFMVSQYVEGRVLTPEQIRDPGMQARVCEVLRRCHYLMPKHWSGPALIFWVFQVIRSYAARLESEAQVIDADALARLTTVAEQLEAAVGPVIIALGHNDLLAANFIDDGERLWLIDWDYAGFNSPLFDLANLSSNNGLDRDSDRELLATYFERAATPEEYRGFRAMVCASLLRETLWARVSLLTSKINFDYRMYADDYQSRFEHEWQQFEEQYG
jgi:thiamine kinase-like enzyme